MDLTQLGQMVAWLDEEHRRDRDELARLDQRLQSMLIERQEQARRIQDLEGRLASTQAQLTRFAQIEQSLQQLKNEVVVLLDKQNEARQLADRESERSRLSDRESFSRNLAELRKELTRLSRVEETLVVLQAEDQRLGEMTLALRQGLNGLSKETDERTRSLPYMVEQRAQDNKRIAQIQAENTELLKRTDALSTRFTLMEERLQRSEKEIQRIQPLADQLRQDQQTFVEAQKLADVERQRQMEQWQADFALQQGMLEKQALKMREFDARYEAAGRALKALEEFQAHLLNGQKQTAELQRLAEERQRKELTDWQVENEQRWKKESLRWDYNLQEQQKTNQRFAERFSPIEKSLALLQRDAEALWRMHESLSASQVQHAQKLLDLVGASLAARSKPES